MIFTLTLARVVVARVCEYSTYERLDVEALSGCNVLIGLLRKRLQDGGLTGVVETQNKDTCLLGLRLQTAEQLQQTHFSSFNFKLL